MPNTEVEYAEARPKQASREAVTSRDIFTEVDQLLSPEEADHESGEW